MNVYQINHKSITYILKTLFFEHVLRPSLIISSVLSNSAFEEPVDHLFVIMWIY